MPTTIQTHWAAFGDTVHNTAKLVHGELQGWLDGDKHKIFKLPAKKDWPTEHG